jgi:hypothetical protein
MQERGRLAISSYEGLAKHRLKLASLQRQGVCICLVVDEVHESITDFRAFLNFWTLAAGLQPHFVRVTPKSPIRPLSGLQQA